MKPRYATSTSSPREATAAATAANMPWASSRRTAASISWVPTSGCTVFLELANGVDDATWMHHLRAGDYSRWVMAELKDKKLATRLAAIEADSGLTPAESRARVRATIQERYAPPE